MTDLSHLDAAETFSGQEAAALVIGLDPLNPQAELWKTKPVLARMIEGHRISRAFVGQPQPMTADDFKMQRKMACWADALVSILFDQFPLLQKEPWPSAPNRPFELLQRFAGPDGEFEVQKFARAEIQRWLSAVRLESSYQFVKPTVLTAEIDSKKAEIEPSGWADESCRIGVELKKKHPKFTTKQIAIKVHAELIARGITGRGGKTPDIATIIRRGLKGI